MLTLHDSEENVFICNLVEGKKRSKTGVRPRATRLGGLSREEEEQPRHKHRTNPGGLLSLSLELLETASWVVVVITGLEPPIEVRLRLQHGWRRPGERPLHRAFELGVRQTETVWGSVRIGLGVPCF